MTEREAVMLLHRLMRAINEHNLHDLVSCFHPEYQSVQPVHPKRSFKGRHRVAENWGWVFDKFEDFQAEVLDYAVRGSTVWSEWAWHGSGPDEVVEVHGVMILTYEDGLIKDGRLYMESVRE